MSFAMVGAQLGAITRQLGIENEAINAVIGAFSFMGHIIRTINSLMVLFQAVTSAVSVAQTAQTATTTMVQTSLLSYTGAATVATAANYGLAASFMALMAAIGPVGWILMALGIVGAGIAAGYMLGGAGAAGPVKEPTIGPEPFVETGKRAEPERVETTVNVDINKVGIRREFEAAVQTTVQTSTGINVDVRKYRA